ncbi:MAG: 30S ribosomal protein S3 [Candidatus Aenigmarchaeota archaeon]|nr:30S ribosomal protein S3 [Candidatus Aenigmarchaeota archaeon]
MVVEDHFIKEGKKEVEIEEYLINEFDRAGYSHIDIQRTPLGTRIVVYANRPGLVIGRSGSTIKRITEEIKEKFELENPMLDVKEVENPFLDAQVVATRIANSIERGTFYKKVVGFYLSKIMEMGAIGVQIKVSGKLGGERGRLSKFKDGYIKHAGHYADNILDKGRAKAVVKLGVVGVEVKIMKEMPENISLKISEVEEEIKRRESIPEPEEKVIEEEKGDEKKEKTEKKEEPKKTKKTKEKKVEKGTDYEKILSNSISDAKKKIKKLKEPDYKKLMEVEKKNKDRKGMKDYLKEKLGESKEKKSSKKKSPSKKKK